VAARRLEQGLDAEGRGVLKSLWRLLNTRVAAGFCGVFFLWWAGILAHIMKICTT
jgi:hypothetical protein